MPDISIKTHRLILRHWSTVDAEDLYKYASDGRVSEMALWPRHTSVEMSKDVIERIFLPNPDSYAITLKESGKPIGSIGLVPQGLEHHATIDEEREVGYWIGYPYWNKGIATEALNALIEFYRDKHTCKSLLITTDARNVASQRVAAKCRFELIDSYLYDGVPSKAYRCRLTKDLCDMTLEELWHLFPIFLTPYQPQWREWAKEEIGLLSELLAEYSPVINHIGSTAIPGIQAKPIIDILVEIPSASDWQRIRIEMEAAGYICMSSSDGRMCLNKGYTPEGYAERVFHIHFHIVGDNDEILFRDYLSKRPTVAQEYEKLKLSLLPKYQNDRDGYTNAKSDFIKEIVNKASLMVKSGVTTIHRLDETNG